MPDWCHRFTGGRAAAVVMVAAASCGSPSAGSQTVIAQIDGGAWVEVTPADLPLTSTAGCDSYGVTALGADPARPADIYAFVECQGIWKSDDAGLTWAGPINVGRGGEAVRECAGGMAVGEGGSSGPPVIYVSCIRGAGLGFHRSLDGGVNWMTFYVDPNGGVQDVSGVSIDPYDSMHIVTAWHEADLIVESEDGGETWREMPIDSGMHMQGGTGFVDFVDTGDAATTRSTLLFSAQGAGGNVGTWRTTTAGRDWQRVDSSEKPHGTSQLFQPDADGVIYLAGQYSELGTGVLRSQDYGETWEHVGHDVDASVVYGSDEVVYSMYSWACKGCDVDTEFQFGSVDSADGWRTSPTPDAMNMGAAAVVTVFDGEHYVFVSGNWDAGLWRFVEP